MPFDASATQAQVPHRVEGATIQQSIWWNNTVYDKIQRLLEDEATQSHASSPFSRSDFILMAKYEIWLV